MSSQSQLQRSLATSRVPLAEHPTEKKSNPLIIVGGVAAVIAIGLFAKSWFEYQAAKKHKTKSALRKSTQPVPNDNTTITASNTIPQSDTTTPSSSENLTDSTLTGSSYVVPTVDVSTIDISDDTLRDLLGQSLDSMNNTGQINETDNLLDILRQVSQSDVTKYSEQTRLVAAQWFVIYHTLKAIRLGGPESEQQAAPTPQAIEEIKQWNREHVADMTNAWRIIDGLQPTDMDSIRQLYMFKLDIAQRGKDSSKMLGAYQSILSLGNDMNAEETMAAFMVAPLLGRWHDTRTLGVKVSEYQSWPEFHQLALQRPDIPDYSVLYNLAEKLSQSGDAPLSGAGWETMDVIHIQSKVKSYNGPEQHRPPTDSPADKRDIPAGSCAYHRMGSVARMISPSPIPIPLTGVADNQQFQLEGKAEIPAGPNTEQLIAHSESYQCKLAETKNNTQIWRGTYTIQQESVNSNAHYMKVTFDVEMHMTKSDM